MLKHLLTITSFAISAFVYSQTYTIDGADVTDCNGTFADAGGTGNNPASSYGNGEYHVITICPDNPGSQIQLDFTMFDVEANYDFLCVYDGTSTAAVSLGCYDNNVPLLGTVGSTDPSGCLTFEFDSDLSVTELGWEATISCSQPCQTVIADPTFGPAPDVDGAIRLCQGDVLAMTGDAQYPDNNTGYTQSNGTSTFEWIVQDNNGPTTYTGQNQNIAFPNSGIYVVQLDVTDVMGCESANAIDQYVYVSTTPIFDGMIIANDPICLGDQNTLTGDATPVLAEYDCTPPVSGLTPLPDGSGVSYSTSVTVDCYGPGQTITNQAQIDGICINMEHSYAGDLEIAIECPDGTQVILVDYPNGLGNAFIGEPVDNTTGDVGNGYQYCFTPTPTYGTWAAENGNYTYSYTDNIGTNYTNVEYLPPGDYASENSLGGLNGCPLNGDWSIVVTDNLGADDGYIFDWQINFNPGLTPAAASFTPTIVSDAWQADPTIVSGTNPIVVEPTATGNACYTYEVTDDFNCTYDTTVCFTVVPTPVLDPIADVTVCSSYTLPAISGTDLSGNEAYFSGPNGTGTQYAPGAAITTSGTYYAYDATNGPPVCTDEVSFNITILQPPVVDDIANVTACDSYTLPAITGTNLTGNEAFYTASGGLGTQYNAGDVLTGSDLIFIYDETGTTPNCFDQESFNVTINTTPDAGVDVTIDLCDSDAGIDLDNFVTGDPGGNWTVTGGAPGGNFNTATGNLNPNNLNGTYTFEYTALAAAPCVNDVAIFTVNIDGQDPVINCPGNLTAVCDISEQPAYATLAQFTTAGGTATDETSLDAASFTLLSEVSDNNSCPEVVTRTYQIADDCGHTSTCVQTITIDDNINPTGTAPANINVECTADVPAANPALITDEADNCGIQSVVHVGDVSDNNTCPETITRTYRITDLCGNFTDVTQTITVQDVTAPVLDPAPANVTVECIGDVPAMTNLNYTDNCDAPGSVAGVDGALVGGACGGTITRTWTYTDACGNVATATQTITVDDTTLPTASNPVAVNVECAVDVPAADITVVTDEADNCTANPVVAFVSDVSDNNTCPETITRTYSVTDDCGNSINVTQTITIQDVTAPVLDPAPANVTVECIGDVPAMTNLNYTDNCDAPGSVAGVDGALVGGACGGTITRTWTYTDACGNVATATQTITIDDTTPPTASNPVAVNVECAADVPATDITVVTDEADNCTANPVVAFVSDVSDNNTCPETITRTYSVTDDCGNSINVTQTITIQDVTAPVLDPAPADVTVECIGDVPAMTNLNYTDNCDAPGSVAGVDGALVGGACGGTITRTWTYTDACGNVATAAQTITIDDTTPPVLDPAPADVTVECIGDVPAMTNLNYTDNCDAPGSVAGVDGALVGGACGGTITRTWTYTDACGNVATATQTITIDDTTPPVLDPAPADVTVECVGDVPAMTNLNYTDNCDAPGSVAGVDGALVGGACGGTITRTWTYTDACGNVATATQTITIDDTTPPTASNPADINTTGAVPAPDPTVVTDEADNCTANPVVAFVSDVSDGGNCPETITRTYSITDDCGNTINVIQLIIIGDANLPTASNPANINVECITAVPAADPAVVTDEADDTGVPTVALQSETSDGNTCPETITRVYSVTDDCGNVITVQHDIIVQDVTPPTASNPADINVQCAADVPAADITVVTDEADNCGTPTVAFVSDVSDNNTCPETITRTYSVTDSCGNSINVTQNIIINDTQAPTGTAPAAVNVECVTAVPAADPAVITDEADNCTAAPTVIHLSDVSDGNSCPETITRTYRITDDCGNTTDLVQTITINDITLPTASNPAQTVVPGGPAPAPDPTVVIDEADNCGIPTVAFVSQVSDNNPCPETITYTYSVTDSCGNSINVTHEVLITDPIAPTGTAPADIAVECIDLVPAADPLLITDEADNNGVPTVTHLSDVSDGNTCPETITRTYRITDACANFTDVTQTITVHDLTSPTASNPADINVQCAADVPAADITVVTDEADNCGTPTVAFVSDVSDNNTCPETITRTYSVTDSCGNSINVTQNIIINDTQAPTATAPAAVNVECVTAVPAADPLAITDEADNCTAAPAVIHLSDVSDGNSCPETITRTYRITDDCGNFTDVTQTITINDITLPTASNPAQTIVPGGPAPAPDPTVVIDEADNCGTPTVAFVSQVSDNNPCPETITYTYSVTDSCGNSINVTHEVLITDPIAPTGTPPADVTVDCIDLVPAADPLLITDEADNNGVPTVTHLSDVSDGNTCPETITRTYRITDPCSNFIDVTQIITVHDLTAPTASNPADINVQCAADVPAADITVVTDEADNCGTPTVAFVSDVSDNNTCPETITRTYSVTDSCGNSINVTQNIIINDTQAPTGTAPAAVNVECVTAVPAADPAVITDEADNCTAAPTVIHLSDVSDGNSCPETITRTYRITDDCGNFTDVTQTITINDITLPTASNPAQTIVPGGPAPAPDPTVVIDEADNCGTPTVAFVSQVSDNNPCPETITYTYSVTDSCGNSINVTHEVLITDPIAPTGTAPADVAVECIDLVPAADPALIVDEADNNGVPTVTHLSDVSDGNTCPETITRTYRITDACGNFIDVVQLITVHDLTAPTASNPADVNVQCAADVPAADITVVTDEADNCGTPTVAFVSDVSDNNTCPETITRTYSVTDSCGNSINVTQNIIINDTQAPTATAPAAVNVECVTAVPPADILDITDEADNCTANPTVVHVGDVSDGNSCPETITRTYSITDDCGNQITVDQIITINDVTPPTASNPADVIVPGGPAPAPDPTVVNDEADNCGTPTVAFVSDVSDNNPCPETIVRTYSVTDSCGNSINVVQNIIITDPISPTGTAPADVAVECIDLVPAADPTLIVDEADNNGVPTVTHLSDVSDGNTCPEIITRTYRITDLCGNITDVTQLITVQDLTAPTASNPADINVECIGDVPASDITVVIDEADNCGTPTVAFVSDVSDNNTCPETITRTYSVTDSCGNSINVTQNIIVNDITPPTGTAPADITVQCIGDVPADDVALITDEADNCTANPTVTFIGDASDGNTCPEVITRTYRITDDCGNFIDVNQTITVNDDIDPTASNPAPIAVALITDVPAPDPTVVTDEADNCTANPAVVWVSDVSDNNTCPETIIRTYSVTDDCGNQITVEQTITVQDLTPPTASNPAPTNVECITAVPAVDPAVVIDEADNSGVANVAFVSETSDGNTCPETITRVYSVTDDCGNQITVDHVITVQDITPPTASNPANVNVECVADVPAADITVVTDEADNCGTPTVAFVSDVSDNNTCPETITRTYSVTDSCGNSINVQQLIIVNDVTPPTGTAPADITVQCIGDVPADDVALITDEADNCTANPTVTFIGDASDGNTCPEIITRTYRITDDCGNFTDVNQTITVNDDINPTASNPAGVTVAVIGDVPAPDPTVVTDEADNCTANPVVVHVGDVSDGNTCPETITRTYSVTDDCGNQITVDQIITVSDTQAPTASNPAPVNVQCIGDVPAVDITVVTDEADNSGVVPTVAHVSDVSDGNTCPEVITRTYSVTDDCGNSINVTQTITVNDDILPTASNALTTNVECIGDVPAVDVNVITDEADNCTAAPLVAFVSEVSDGNTCPETITRTYSVTDDCGNSIDVTHTIVVNDITNPTASAPAALNVQCIGDVPLPDVSVITDEADNCTAAPLVAHVADVSDGNTCPEVITRTYSITDDCGNQITVDQIITVNDDQAPTASNLPAVNVECIGDVPPVNIADVTDEADNCTAAPLVAHVSDVSDGNTCPEVITRTYSVTDDCGNSINVTQTITVNDITLPTASNPAPIDVACAGDVPLADVTVVTDEADNCTVAPVVAFVSDVSDGNVCNGEVITRTYSVTDDCGNQIFVTQQINIAVVTPQVNAGIDQGVCEDVQVTLTAENPNNATITWDNGVTDGVPFFPPLGTTTYNVTASQCGGECFATDAVDVTVHPTPVIALTADDLYACEPHTVNFTNQSTEQFDCVWDFGDGNVVQDCGPVSNVYENAGIYDVTLTVTSDQGCTATDTYNDYIEVVPFPVAAFTYNPTELDIMDTEVEFTNESMYADSYTWSFGDFSPQSSETDPTHVFPDANGGSYTVTLVASSNAGCEAQATAVITIDDVLIFYVPNVFTPDGNSINNTFFPVFTAGYDPYDYHLSIFNRWGELIFESYNAGVGWDGTYGGTLVQDGVYVWQLEFGETMSDKKHKHRGHVTVLK